MRAYALVRESGGDTNRAAAGRSVCNLVAMRYDTTNVDPALAVHRYIQED